MTEYINRQWRLPNAAEGNFKDYSMSLSSGQYLTLQNSPNLRNFNISFWMKVDSYSSEITVIGSSGVSGFTFESATSLKVIVNSTSYSWSPGWTLTTGEWQHIVFSRDENHLITAFRNGIHYTANAPTTAGSYFNGNFIGRLGNATGTFIGEIAELAYFEHNLSQSNIDALYNDGQPGNPMSISPTPLRYYKLGNSLFDGAYLVPNQANEETVLNFSNYTTGSYGVVRAATNQDFDNIQKFTFCGWIKFFNVPGNKHIFAIDDAIFPHGQRIDINMYKGSLRFNVNYPTGTGAAINNINTSTPSVGNNQWFHYSGVFDGTFTDSDINVQNAGRLKLYLNAVPQTVTFFNPTLGVASSTGSINFGSETVVGGYLNGTFPGFNGPASNFQLFDDALTPSEILTVYNSGTPLTDVNNIPKINNLKVWYKLDGNNSIWNNEDTEWKVDNSKNSSNYRSSLSFDGNDDYVDFGNSSSLQLVSSFTLSAWVRLTSLASGQSAAIISKGTVGGSDRSVSLYLSNSSGHIIPHIAISEDGSSWALSAVGGMGVWNGAFGPWHNITATFNGSTEAKLYVNGVNVATDTASPFTPISTSSSFRIGLDAENDNDLNGKVSNVSVFNTVLPETGSNSIETLYNNGTPLADINSFSSLVSWWKLDNTVTGIEDSNGTNNGTNNGATLHNGFVNTLAGDSENMNQQNLIKNALTTTEIYSPYALAFDGNDYIDLGNDSSLRITTAMTISCWIKTTNSGNNTIIGRELGSGTGRDWKLYLNNGNVLFWCSADGTAGDITILTSSFTVNDGNWHNLIAVNDGTNQYIYIDGNLNNSNSGGQTINASTTNNYIGARNANTFFLNGSLSNLSIWNTALTSSQVTEIYSEGIPQNLNNHSAVSSLVSWWQLGSNSSWTSPSWTVLDEVGINNGTSWNMLENAITNGVGDPNYAVSVNMSLGNNISGSYPNGDFNCLSVNMGINSRSSDYNN